MEDVASFQESDSAPSDWNFSPVLEVPTGSRARNSGSGRSTNVLAHLAAKERRALDFYGGAGY